MSYFGSWRRGQSTGTSPHNQSRNVTRAPVAVGVLRKPWAAGGTGDFGLIRFSLNRSISGDIFSNLRDFGSGLRQLGVGRSHQLGMAIAECALEEWLEQ